MHITVDGNSCGKVITCKYFSSLLTNQISIHEKIKCRLKQEIHVITQPKSNENREWRRLQKEKLHNVYPSPKIVRVIKSRILRWTGHVAKMEYGRLLSKL